MKFLKILFIALGIAILSGIGAVSGVYLTNNDIQMPILQSSATEEHINIELEPFVTNVNTEEAPHSNKYLQITLTIVANGKHSATTLENNTSKLRDTIITHLSKSTTAKNIVTNDIEKLKQSTIVTIEQEFNIEITEVLITDMLLQ